MSSKMYVLCRVIELDRDSNETEVLAVSEQVDNLKAYAAVHLEQDVNTDGIEFTLSEWDLVHDVSYSASVLDGSDDDDVYMSYWINEVEHV